MLENIKNHPIGYSLILITATASVITGGLYGTVIRGLENDLSFALAQRNSFQTQTNSFQQTISNISASCDSRTSERVDEYKEIFNLKQNMLNAKIIDLETKLNSNQLADSSSRRTVLEKCAGYTQLASTLELLKNQEIKISGQLDTLYEALSNTKSKYLYSKVECTKANSQISNICELAHAASGRVDVLEQEIEAKNQLISNISNQIIKYSQLM